MQLGRCIHESMRGIEHVCAKGHDIQKLAGPERGSFYRIPCIDFEVWGEGRRLPIVTEGQASCPDRELPTPDQFAAFEAEDERWLKAMMAGRCPKCDAELVKREHASGFVSSCPTHPEVYMRGCRPTEGGGR